jgi:hypothetical protein
MPRAPARMSSLGALADAIARVDPSDMVRFLLNG